MRTTWLLVLAACNGHGQRPDGGPDNGIDAKVVLVDGAIDAAGFVCANDSAFEPNDTTTNAFSTPVDANATFSVAAAAICPVADKDHYRINMTGVKAIEVILQWDSGLQLSASILNAGGTSLANATTIGTNMARACVPNVPAGTYYALVFASGTTQNNYRLTINAKGSCN